MHSKRKVICGILFVMGAATGTIINAGVAAAAAGPGHADPCGNGGRHDAEEAEVLHGELPGNHLGQRCDEIESLTEVEEEIVGGIVPVAPALVGNQVIVGGIVPVVQVPGGNQENEGGIVPVVQVPGGNQENVGGDVPVTPAPSGIQENVGGDTVETPEEDGTVEGSVDIGDALVIVREQPVTPVVVVQLPEMAAPVAIVPAPPAAAPVAVAPAAVVTQPAPKAPTSAVVAPVTSGRSVTSVTTSSATSEVLGVQYSRLAATGSDPLPLALLALGLLLLGGAMVVTTSRQPS